MNKRPILHKGARVALVAPSSPIPEEKISQCRETCEMLGLEPIVFESVMSNRKYLAGSDVQRASDINRAFADKSIDGVWAVRGGYGANRILPLIDFDTIASNPKFFGGYSDITALNTAINQRAGFVTYHCIMASSDSLAGDDEYSLNSLKAMMFGGKAPYFNPEDVKLSALNSGRAEGELCGGNLSLLVASLGTPWEIDTRGKILFIEEVDERPYRIDSFLTSLRNAGKLDECAGILLGQFTRCEPREDEKSLTLDEVFSDLIAPSGKPVVKNVLCGHCSPSLSLPIGAEFFVDADNATFGEK